MAFGKTSGAYYCLTISDRLNVPYKGIATRDLSAPSGLEAVHSGFRECSFAIGWPWVCVGQDDKWPSFDTRNFCVGEASVNFIYKLTAVPVCTIVHVHVMYYLTHFMVSYRPMPGLLRASENSLASRCGNKPTMTFCFSSVETVSALSSFPAVKLY